MCHFHQKKVIQRYITMHLRLAAGKDFQKIIYSLKCYEKYRDFLVEKTINYDTLKESFTDQELVSAYKSLVIHLPYLFTRLLAKLLYASES